jgi:hypothetical protein
MKSNVVVLDSVVIARQGRADIDESNVSSWIKRAACAVTNGFRVLQNHRLLRELGPEELLAIVRMNPNPCSRRPASTITGIHFPFMFTSSSD